MCRHGVSSWSEVGKIESSPRLVLPGCPTHPTMSPRLIVLASLMNATIACAGEHSGWSRYEPRVATRSTRASYLVLLHAGKLGELLRVCEDLDLCALTEEIIEDKALAARADISHATCAGQPGQHAAVL